MSADEPLTDAAVAEEIAAWREYRGRQGHPTHARWLAAMRVVDDDADVMDRWREVCSASSAPRAT